MKVENFFKEFVIIESHLFNLAGNFDRRQGFLNLLKHLHSKNLLPKDVLTDLDLIRHIRNKVANSPHGEEEIPDEVFDRLTRIKSKLGL